MSGDPQGVARNRDTGEMFAIMNPDDLAAMTRLKCIKDGRFNGWRVVETKHCRLVKPGRLEFHDGAVDLNGRSVA